MSSSSRPLDSSKEHTSYFLPGYGISRQVIFTKYQILPGPAASIRPFSYQQREGYLVSHAGSPLTKVGSMIVNDESSPDGFYLVAANRRSQTMEFGV